MNEPRSPQGPDAALAERRGYHHGHLRDSLIEAARRLIAERGPAGFTLSDAAKLAGVSPAAPYRHFKDRQALLAEVALLGFRALHERQAAAVRSASPGPEAFFAMGKAYLAFAREEPAFYAAMFNSGLAGKAAPSGNEDQGYAMLRQAVGQALGLTDPQAIELAAALVFALTHGLASLSAPDTIAMPGGIADPERALELGVTSLLRGLPSVLADKH